MRTPNVYNKLYKHCLGYKIFALVKYVSEMNEALGKSFSCACERSRRQKSKISNIILIGFYILSENTLNRFLKSHIPPKTVQNNMFANFWVHNP